MTISTLHRLIHDDSGQDLVEYAVLTGMVGVGSLLFFVLLSTVMGFRYQTWLIDIYNAWEPCPPAPGVCP